MLPRTSLLTAVALALLCATTVARATAGAPAPISIGGAPEPHAAEAAHTAFSLSFGWRFHLGPMNRSGGGPCEMIDGRDIGTGSIATPTTPTADACCAACVADPACAAWDWVTTGSNVCYLKDNANGNVTHAERVTGAVPPASPPVAPGFPDDDWARVDLPHDYSINLTFAASNDNYYGYLPHAPSWYRRNFTVDASLRGGTLFLLADSAMRNARVWLNGVELGAGVHKSGYNSWGYYVTDAVVYGAPNTLAVFVSPSNDEGAWWYGETRGRRRVWMR